MTLAAVLVGLTLSWPQETLVLRTGDGALLGAWIDKPAGSDPVPAVVVCPGESGDRTSPAVASVAAAAVAGGAMAVTFDWLFVVKSSRPSVGLTVELDSLATVLGHLDIHPRWDGRTVLVGQGLGAVVAYRQFAARARVVGLVLVDPPATSPAEVRRTFPGLDGETRPVRLLSSGPPSPGWAQATTASGAVQAAELGDDPAKAGQVALDLLKER